MTRRSVLVAFALLVVAALPAEAQKRGGVLRVGILGEPPALDAHWSTTALVETLTNHVYEGLYTLDQNNRPIPMLAESLPAVSPDQLTYTFKLRPGVRFHNGKELGAEDVVASLKRWGQQAELGEGALQAGRRPARRRPADRGAPPQRALAHHRARPGHPEQLRGDLPEGGRREVPAAAEGHRVRGDGPLPGRRVEARPVPPDGAVRPVPRAAASRRTATAAPRSPTWTRCGGSRCRTSRPAPRRSRRASSTSPTT